ncbi:hypothetical protein HMPREF0995_04765 [Lachnospiraceae bacterium 7_1_58FAA]|nr:hypothetical protein HMPREF0995_04765 [Lachnospiraceae bacterium 7_1_58FAA]
MDLIKQIYILFDNFSDENCRMWNGYNPDWRPNWNEEIEDYPHMEQRTAYLL